MWSKIKIAFFSALIGAVSLAFILLFRRGADGSGVSRADDLNRDIVDGLGRVQDGIDDSAVNIEQGNEKVGTVLEGLGNTEIKLQSALGILRNAKEKARPNMDR